MCIVHPYFRLTANNVLGIRNFAETLMCPALFEDCNRFINKNFVQVAKSEEFLELCAKDLCDILESDELHVTNEEQVCTPKNCKLSQICNCISISW